ncbi:hypothetical protein BDR03DRAFT_61205 [Suillus americanus]|nr:hypothetical protein BDR03DRAFT_61205 [Suillus americanus]
MSEIPYHISQIMHLTFQVVLAVVAALTVPVVANDCLIPVGNACTSGANCCSSQKCTLVTIDDDREVSMSGFIKDLLTYRRDKFMIRVGVRTTSVVGRAPGPEQLKGTEEIQSIDEVKVLEGNAFDLMRLRWLIAMVRQH